MSYTQKRHSKSYQRYHDFLHIKKKEKIIQWWGNDAIDGITRGQMHRLSKGKIHCTCPMCRQKTKEIGWKHADLIKLLKSEEKEA